MDITTQLILNTFVVGIPAAGLAYHILKDNKTLALILSVLLIPTGAYLGSAITFPIVAYIFLLKTYIKIS